MLFWSGRLLTFFKIIIFEKLFQEYYQRVRQFRSRSGPIFCLSRSTFKLFANVFSRRQKWQRKNLSRIWQWMVRQINYWSFYPVSINKSIIRVNKRQQTPAILCRSPEKGDNFQTSKIFLFCSTNNIHCGYSKELSPWDNSFKFPQCMFW